MTSTKAIAPVIAALAVTALLMILNETALSVALPQIMGDFNVAASTAQWLTTGFLLTMAVVIPTTGYLLQRFTIRTLFIAAVVLFVIGTVLAGVAPSFAVLLLGRVVQAGGTAVVLPLLMTTTLTYVPAAYLGTVMGLNSVVISVAPALGPTVAGLIVGSLGWRWMFGLMLAIGVLVLLVGLFLIRIKNDTRNASLDALSVVLSAFGFGGLVFGLSSLGNGAAQEQTISAMMIGVIALVLFVARQIRLRRSGSALLDLSPFRVHNFRISVVIVIICMTTMLGTVMVLPIYLQDGLGASAVTTGLLLLPGGLAQGLLSPFAGRIYDKFGPRPLVLPGSLLLAGGQWWLSTVDISTELGLVVAMHVVFCIGMAMLMTPLMTLSLGSLPRNSYAHGSAIMNTLQQLAGAAGTALLVAAMSAGAAAAIGDGHNAAHAQAFGAQDSFVLGGCLALVTVLCAPFVRRAPVK